MIINTIISSLIFCIEELGHITTTSPIDLFIKSSQAIGDVVSVTEGDSDFSPFESHTDYMVTSDIIIEILVKTNDNAISSDRARSIRNDVIHVIRSYSDHQIIMRRMSVTNDDTGSVMIVLSCSVDYQLTNQE